MVGRGTRGQNRRTGHHAIFPTSLVRPAAWRDDHQQRRDDDDFRSPRNQTHYPRRLACGRNLQLPASASACRLPPLPNEKKEDEGLTLRQRFSAHRERADSRRLSRETRPTRLRFGKFRSCGAMARRVRKRSARWIRMGCSSVATNSVAWSSSRMPSSRKRSDSSGLSRGICLPLPWVAS